MATSTRTTVVAFIEAPGKARWFSEHLGKYFPGVTVIATKGLLFNLPPIVASTNIAFERLDNWQPIPGKPIDTVVRYASEATHLILACDDDPEGDLISSHIAYFASPGAQLYRLKLGSLTPSSLEKAVNQLERFEGKAHAAISRRCFDYSLQTCFTELADGLPVSRVLSPALKLVAEAEYKPSILSGSLQGYTVSPSTTDYPLLEDKSANIDGVVRYDSAETIEVASAEPSFLNTRDLLVEGHISTGIEPDVIYRIAQDLYEQGVVSYIRTTETSGSSETIAGVASITSSLGLQAPVGLSLYAVPKGPHQAIMPLCYLPELYGDLGERGQVYRFILHRSISELYRADYPSRVTHELSAVRTIYGQVPATLTTYSIDLGFGKGMQRCHENSCIPLGQAALDTSHRLALRSYSRVAQIIDLLHASSICPPGQYLRQAQLVSKFLSYGFELSGRGIYLQNRLDSLLPTLSSLQTASDLQRIFADESLDGVERLMQALNYMEISDRVDLDRDPAPAPARRSEELESAVISQKNDVGTRLSYHPFSPGR